MSEDEIIKGITNIIYTCNDAIEDKEWYDQEEIESAKEQLKFTEGILDLYQKEKEKNKEYENKIKEKIKLINSLNEKIYYEENVISILQELLEERN